MQHVPINNFKYHFIFDVSKYRHHLHLSGWHFFQIRQLERQLTQMEKHLDGTKQAQQEMITEKESLAEQSRYCTEKQSGKEKQFVFLFSFFCHFILLHASIINLPEIVFESWQCVMASRVGHSIYRISPCIMRCFFLDIHITKRHLILYIDAEFNTKFSGKFSSGKTYL